jgi:putative salt-induced outer membrane protein YdiY
MHLENSRCSAALPLLALLVFGVDTVSAQPAPAAPSPPWAGSAGAGLTVTGGNSDVKQYNVGFEAVANPNPKSRSKFEGQYLRGTNDGVLAVSRASLGARQERRLTNRVFAFGQVGYLSDEFKQIDYLVSPTGGLGLEVVKTAATQFTVDGGAGVIWEKNPGLPKSTSGALTAGESFAHKISTATAVTQGFRGLWKTKDLADSLYTFNAGLSTALAGPTQLKIDLLDTYKHLPPNPSVKKNDVALVIALVYKF